MKRFFFFIALLSTIPVFAANFPIKNGLLQDDLNAGGHSITNVTDVKDSNGNSLLGGGGGGSATNIYKSQVSGTALQLATNISTLVYTFSLSANLQSWDSYTPSTYSNFVYAVAASASAGAALSATNGLGLPSGLSAFRSTNSFDAAGTATAATNGYPWASLYDASGAALSATNGMGLGSGLSAFRPTNTFDAAGAAIAVTNGYPWGSLYDLAGRATAATNGYPWSALYDATGTALGATNGLSLASGLAAFRGTNTLASTNAATTSVRGLVKPDGTTITIASDGTISAETGGSGDVTGPASATDGNFPLFNGTSGKSLKTSAYSPASFDGAGAATSATNGYPWGTLYDASGTATTAATAATNGIGVGSQLAAFAPTNQFDAAGAANTASNALSFTLLQTNVAQYADLLAGIADLNASSVSNNFVDGMVFRPQYGLLKSLRGGTISGTTTNYTSDGFGNWATNGISLTLPSLVSNVTVVVAYRPVPTIIGGNTVFALGNSTTKSSIEVTDDGGGNFQVWENYRLTFYNARANPGYTNVFSPLWMNAYSATFTESIQDQPRFFAFVRDTNATWRVYMDSVQGKIGSSTPAFTFTCPTNATDPFDTLYLGTSGVTNKTYSNAATNGVYASVMIFNTTNVAAVLQGYRSAALFTGWPIDIFIGDSRFSDNTTLNNPVSFYSAKYPQHLSRNYAQGGSKLFDQTNFWAANGGLGVITNLPAVVRGRTTVFNNAGVNDFYANGTSASGLFAVLTNISRPIANYGVRYVEVGVAGIATNATNPYTYALATETNIFNFDQLVSTNQNIGVSQFIPLWQHTTQWSLNTNGPFTVEGLHFNGRTNWGFNAAEADLMDGRPFNILSNSFYSATGSPFPNGLGVPGVYTNDGSFNSGWEPLTDFAKTNQILSASSLIASAHVKTDGTTNLVSSEDGTGYTNLIAYTHQGTATNLTATFNGTLQSFTVTNGPTVFFHYAGANGSVSYRFTTNVTLAFDYQPKWLAGSNSSITNGVLSLTSYGGTNATQIEAAMKENQ